MGGVGSGLVGVFKGWLRIDSGMDKEWARGNSGVEEWLRGVLGLVKSWSRKVVRG